MTPQQRYYLKNKKKLLENGRARYCQNIVKERERSKQYAKKNKEVIRVKRSVRMRLKRKTDSSFRIRCNISRSIRDALRRNGGSKGGLSFLEFAGYRFIELKLHLEKQFEPWMSWNNYGVYNSKTWDNNDPSTWTWQLDHIIPQSQLPYVNMEDDNFKKCWALDNLRPLSAKQNFLNGIELLKVSK